MEQVLSILEVMRKSNIILQNGSIFDDKTPVWFCAFAQFQVNDWKNDGKKNPKTGKMNPLADANGPTVGEQVSLDPFEKVIRAPHCTDMVVIQTTKFDPNTRFWCVIELFEALKKLENDSESFKIHYMFSKDFLKTYVRRQRKYIRPRWEENPNLDDAKSVPFVKVDPSTSTAPILEFVADPGGGNYEILKVGETVQITEEKVMEAAKTWNAGAAKDTWKERLGIETGFPPTEWPKLKYQIFTSHTVFCGWEEKFITISTTTIKEKDAWMEMQTTMITNQEESAKKFMKQYIEIGNTATIPWL